MTYRKNFRLRLNARGVIAIAVLLAAVSLAPITHSQGSRSTGRDDDGNTIQHVMLISIDGMHALDYQNCMNNGTCPNLAKLAQNGVNYTRTSTSKPSDSAPGLMALVTGGTPRSTGVFYDVAYDRVLAPPAKTTGNGVFAGKCNSGQPNGTTTEYEEGVDIEPDHGEWGRALRHVRWRL